MHAGAEGSFSSGKLGACGGSGPATGLGVDSGFEILLWEAAFTASWLMHLGVYSAAAQHPGGAQGYPLREAEPRSLELSHPPALLPTPGW